MKRLALSLLVLVGLGAASPALADAPPDAGTVIVPAFVDTGSQQAAGSAAAPVDQGSGSAITPAPAPTAGSGSAVAAPADKLPNPVDDPLAAIETLKAQKKQGWAFAILAGVLMLTAGFARAASKWPESKLFAWFAKNKTAIFIVGGITAVGSAAFNALAVGGTWIAAGYAAVLAVIALLHPGTPAKA